MGVDVDNPAAATNGSIPSKYKALIYDKPGQISTKVVELDTPAPGPGQALVRLTHSGICHSDLEVMTNGWKLPIDTPVGQVGGHEGVGVVVALGPGTDGTVNIGDRVGVKWVASVCGTCGPCLNARDGLCKNQKISGMFHPGTFQQYLVHAANYLTPIPASCPPELAAPMLCAGITTYAALRKARTRGGQWLVVSGAGGGLGHIAVQLAKHAFALRVIGIDTGNKESFVRECGAEAFVDVQAFAGSKEIVEEVRRVTDGEGAHAVIVCTSSNAAYAQAPDMLRYGGALVCVGLPPGERKGIDGLSPGKIIDKELVIEGSALGTQRDAIECLDFVARGVVKTKVEVRGWGEADETFKQLKAGTLPGRVVLDLS